MVAGRGVLAGGPGGEGGGDDVGEVGGQGRGVAGQVAGGGDGRGDVAGVQVGGDEGPLVDQAVVGPRVLGPVITAGISPDSVITSSRRPAK